MLRKVKVLSEHKREMPPHCKIVLRNLSTLPIMTSELRYEGCRGIDSKEGSK